MTEVGAGHRALQRLAEGEAFRRIMAGELPSTLDEFARELAAWLRAQHPDATPTTKTVEDWIRETWHRRHELIRGG
jgi:hypothetical protein